MISPSTGMSAEHFVNIYSLLFNQASWDAYRERNPNKRCIAFGLIYWAGGQRYMKRDCFPNEMIDALWEVFLDKG